VHRIGCTPNRTPPKFPKNFAPVPRTGPHPRCGPVRFGFGPQPEPDPGISTRGSACRSVGERVHRRGGARSASYVRLPFLYENLFYLSVSASTDLAACSRDDPSSSYSDLAAHCAYISFVSLLCLPQIVYSDAEGGKLLFTIRSY
jgi:hypothetical protein